MSARPELTPCWSDVYGWVLEWSTSFGTVRQPIHESVASVLRGEGGDWMRKDES